MAINNRFQFIRGNKSQNDNFLGKPGEITIDLDTNNPKNLRFHDGSTRGGIRVANYSEIPTRLGQLTNDLNYATTSGQVAHATTADRAKRDGEGDNGNEIHTTYAKLSGATFKGTLKYDVTIPETSTDKTVVNAEWVSKADCVVHTSGDETINGIKTFTSIIKGTAMNANWADLAEYYEADRYYPFGTLVCFGGENEITIATTEVNAVISDQPGLVLNGSKMGEENFLPIALCGRVEICVNGKVNKFDKIVLDKTHPGFGVVDNDATDPIAIALADKIEGEERVLCVSKFKF